MATNPMIPQGVLNRVRPNIVFPGFPGLNITAPYMGRQMARIEFEGSFVTKIPTGTGSVNSPEPFVFATVTVELLRTQALSSNWLAQIQDNSNIGSLTIHSDAAPFQPIALSNVTANMLNPGPFDGSNPGVTLSLRGEFYVNNNLWTYA